MTTDSSRVVTLTAETFDREVLASDRPVLVDFWAPWCGPCRMVAPSVEQLAEEYDGRAKIAKINVDDHPEIAGRFGVHGIPALLFFQGGKLAGEVVGAVPKKVLAEKLDTLLVPVV
jgi:thioredoxin 1